jgi:hypothetical protein
MQRRMNWLVDELEKGFARKAQQQTGICLERIKKGKQAVEAHTVVRRLGSKMAVRLLALGAGRPLPPRKIPGTHFC